MESVASPLVIDGVSTASLVAPGSAEELAFELHRADADGLAVAPVGGGTQLDLGNPPARLDLALQTTGLDKVVEYEPADLTVTVEAGIRFSELQKLLQAQGQLLALDPPVAPEATIGGVIATNASGPLRYAFGTARDLVIGIRVANTDGTLTRAGGRVENNVAGYDLNKLYVGSLGTLAVIVELSFKLAPVPPATATVVGRASAAAIDQVLHSPLAPTAIELVSSGLAGALGLGAGALVVFRVGGYPKAVERQVRDLAALIDVVDAPETVWDSLAEARVAAMSKPLVVKAAAPIAMSSKLVQLLETGLAGLNPVAWAHAGNGVAYAAADAPSDSSPLLSLRQQVAALGDNASLVIQRAPAPLKQGFDIWGNPGASLALMKALKHKLDPNNTLNPGRYVGGI
jgi:glycolate oxidase FAD binding subunit